MRSIIIQNKLIEDKADQQLSVIRYLIDQEDSRMLIAEYKEVKNADALDPRLQLDSY
jgi:hypothetical protein